MIFVELSENDLALLDQATLDLANELAEIEQILDNLNKRLDFYLSFSPSLFSDS